jgi:hypothetical protein
MRQRWGGRTGVGESAEKWGVFRMFQEGASFARLSISVSFLQMNVGRKYWEKVTNMSGLSMVRQNRRFCKVKNDMFVAFDWETSWGFLVYQRAVV